MVRFSASQAVTISVPTQPLSIEDYLSEPERLVHALVDQQQVEYLGDNVFRVKVRGIKFLGFAIQPVCDIEVWLESGTVRLRSSRCQLEGQESFNQKFSMNMQGYLLTQQTAKRDKADKIGRLGTKDRLGKKEKTGKSLRGQANLIVSIDLPQAMRLTPTPILERTGNGLLNGILITLKQRLMRQLIADYCAWAESSSSISI